MLKTPPTAKVIAYAINDSAEEAHGRPKAYGAFTFNHFLSNVAVELQGKQCKAYPGDCLIHASDHPQEYHGEDNTWDSDWCVFDGSGILLLINTLGLPINQIFRPASTHFVAPLLEKIALEHERKANRWEMVVSLGLQELLIKLSRHCLDERTQSNGNGTLDPLEKLQEVRTIVHDQLGRQWTVPDMAKLSNLSPSRFAFLYKNSFEVSPMEDLIRKRIRQATVLLSDTRKSIAEIAEESGF
ncbi:MAG: AraC family transcriptional regulator, partial [Opitutales bacterium]